MPARRIFPVFFLFLLLFSACTPSQSENERATGFTPAPEPAPLSFQTARVRALAACTEQGLPLDAFLTLAVDYAVDGEAEERASLNTAVSRLVDVSRSAALMTAPPGAAKTAATIPARLEAFRNAFQHTSQHYCGKALALTIRVDHLDTAFVTLRVLDGVWGTGLPASFPLTLSRPAGARISHTAAFQLTEADWQALLVAFPTKYGPARWAEVGKFGAFQDGFHFWRATDHSALLHESDVILPYAALAPHLTPLGRQVFGLAVEREGRETALKTPANPENILPKIQ